MKNKITSLLLALAFTVGLASISSDASAYWRHGYYGHRHWGGGGGVRVIVGPGYYNRGYGYGGGCGWIPGHWRYGYWVPGHRAC